MIASVRVSHEPLSGNWEGKKWSQQKARCSNNFMSGENPPIPPPSAAGGLRWQVESPDDPDSIVFDVSIDTPSNDPVLFAGVRNNTTTSYLPPYTDTLPIDRHYYRRGIYIASVFGASGPFTVNVVGAGE